MQDTVGVWPCGWPGWLRVVDGPLHRVASRAYGVGGGGGGVERAWAMEDDSNCIYLQDYTGNAPRKVFYPQTLLESLHHYTSANWTFRATHKIRRSDST